MKNDRRKATAAIITAAALSAAMVTSDNRKEEEKKTRTQIKRERRTVELLASKNQFRLTPYNSASNGY